MKKITFKKSVLKALLISILVTCKSMAAPRVDVDIDDDGLIEIYTLTDLNAMRHVMDGSSFSDGADNVNNAMGCAEGGSGMCIGYELMNDLDFDTDDSGDFSVGDSFYNAGEGWESIGDSNSEFTAVFDGNFYTISNLTIIRPSENNLGLFALLHSPSEVKNIIFASPSIEGNRDVGTVSGKVGRGIQNSGVTRLIRVYIDNAVVDGGDDVGGLVGECNNGCVIEESFTDGVISGDTNVGGINGYTYTSAELAFIKNSYSSATVTASIGRVGGLSGSTEEVSVINSYASGVVSAPVSSGGVSGYDESITGYYDVYWDTITTGQIGVTGNEDIAGDSRYLGLTTTEIQCPTVANDTSCKVGEILFQNWDNSLWDFGSESEYPKLKWFMTTDYYDLIFANGFE